MLRPPPSDAVLNHISQEFAYSDLEAATSCFNASCRLGEGTYGTVFRGTLRDGTEVAIKALASPKEGGFREEVEVLSRFRHPNLVILMGFARNNRERYLVYELLPGGDLYTRVTKDATFDWKQRLNVVLDSSLGLSHLHGSRPQVFHRDVKTQNILMDKNGTGKVADFGLACLAQPNQHTMTVSQTSGTIGYADPLYIRTGVVTEKSEVYSLGMVLMEVISGRPPALQHANGRIEYQFEHLNGDLRRLRQIVDRRACWPPAMFELVGALAFRCIRDEDALRPTFVEIVSLLRQWLRDESLHQPSLEAPAAAAQPAAQPAAVAAPTPMVARPAGYGGVAGYGGAAEVVGAGGYAGHGQPMAPRPHHADPRRASAGAAAGLARNPFDGGGGPGIAAQARPAGQVLLVPGAGAACAAQVGTPGWGERAYVVPALGGGVAEATARPPQTQGPKEEDISKVMEIGFGRQQALDAFKRCSTVEAAVEWLLTNT